VPSLARCARRQYARESTKENQVLDFVLYMLVVFVFFFVFFVFFVCFVVKGLKTVSFNLILKSEPVELFLYNSQVANGSRTAGETKASPPPLIIKGRNHASPQH
jgi:hypothetical protein